VNLIEMRPKSPSPRRLEQIAVCKLVGQSELFSVCVDSTEKHSSLIDADRIIHLRVVVVALKPHNPVTRSMVAATSESLRFQVMRTAFDQVVTRAPFEYLTLEMKAYLFQRILDAATQRETRLEGFMASAAEQMQDIIVSLSIGSVLVEQVRRNPSSREREQ